jgi:hypothetical protein
MRKVTAQMEPLRAWPVQPGNATSKGGTHDRARTATRHRPHRPGLGCNAFMLPREAMRCTPKTLDHDDYTLGSFTTYLAHRGGASATPPRSSVPREPLLTPAGRPRYR